jgi:hypothetical protein
MTARIFPDCVAWRAIRSAAVACVVLHLMAPCPAEARATGQGETRIAECIRQAADGHPWLERALWGLRDQEGGWIGAEVRNTNGSHDLGPLQINTWWVPKIASLVGRPQADVRGWLMSDPCFNAEAARWIFLSALKTTGDFWKAIGVYHSPTVWRQRRYALSVGQHMQRRFGSGLFVGQTISQPALATVPIEHSQDPSRTFGMKVQYHGFGAVLGPSN